MYGLQHKVPLLLYMGWKDEHYLACYYIPHRESNYCNLSVVADFDVAFATYQNVKVHDNVMVSKLVHVVWNVRDLSQIGWVADLNCYVRDLRLHVDILFSSERVWLNAFWLCIHAWEPMRNSMLNKSYPIGIYNSSNSVSVRFESCLARLCLCDTLALHT